ncbi:MAG: hypothetical protein GY950_17195 [bacterium]|nr:hypothetical protein [bacterium]
MKIKKFNKNLTLNKRTIAHLDRDDMKDARGGASTPDAWSLPGCNTSVGGPCHYTYCMCETEMPYTCLTC